MEVAMTRATRAEQPAGRREAGLVVIIAYKLVKGVLWLVLALVLLVATRMGLAGHLLGAADHLRHNAHAWSLALAKLLVQAATRRGMWTLIVALLVDGVASLVEGWALYHGRWWGPWLVVATTASLLPFEVVALVRHVHAERIALLVVNLAIVVYLARKAVREARAHRTGDDAMHRGPRVSGDALPPRETSPRPLKG